MRVLIAPLEFKGSLAADEAADAIARGIQQARPAWELDVLPLSDGGPGFIDALRQAVPSDGVAVAVQDALGRPVLARYLVFRGSPIVAVEAAQSNGLFHVAPGDRDALRAHTFGVGELLRAAVTSRPRRLVVGVGGSATSDGGAGMAMALGASLLDGEGRPIGTGVRPLLGLARIEWRRPASFEGIKVVVGTDVTNPLVGEQGAAAVYGPQKGASTSEVRVIEAALARYAHVARECLGVEIANLPGAGAAGGLAGGLVAFLGAGIVSGFEVVADATGLRSRMDRADVVITGEGSFDAQSRQGKGPGRVLLLARELGVRAIIFAGRSSDPANDVHVLASLDPDPARCMREAAGLLEQLARDWARSA